MAETVSVPILGSAPCGMPLMAEENIESHVKVSVKLAKRPHRHYILRAVGDSMDRAGITDGDLVLVRFQPIAEENQIVIALIDGEATIKKLTRSKNSVILEPFSSNPEHQQIVLERDFQIQGVVIQAL